MTGLLSAASAQKLSAVAQDLDRSPAHSLGSGRTRRRTRGRHNVSRAEASVSQFFVQGRRRFSLILRNVQDQLAAESRLRELQEEAAYLWGEINENRYNGEILGNSPAIRELITAIHQVAPTPATVFVSGETGTGKGTRCASNPSGKRSRIQPFHSSQLRRDSCGFVRKRIFLGHERGAFTGAAARRIGRFELANGGTIFLDEVGELPLEMQPKLLRVLQEGEFEPVGSSQTRKVNVRVIAATNRDLAAEVAAGRFREDLFYRLHVFPVSVPALRDRGSDVELLAECFLRVQLQTRGKTAARTHRRLFAPSAFPIMAGQCARIGKLIERAVIIARDGRLNLRDVLPLHSLPRREAAQKMRMLFQRFN